MNRIFSRTAWNDFMEWVKEDRKLACKVDALLSDIERNGHEGIGKPEALRHDFAGYWSRRIPRKTVSSTAAMTTTSISPLAKVITTEPGPRPEQGLFFLAFCCLLCLV